ncbi:Retrovirus-related Pol polyprotein from transposon [Trichinella britovi]|uniref:Retrovirus-related Pol polyprotein from transposon n=1 Tax=Trichinella britovi TaxID=45882 RepID=A0A0V1C562_TRIBR|nr:Retrovirus-related Pol polyprotein from transposon [Trichinella britovi]
MQPRTAAVSQLSVLLPSVLKGFAQIAEPLHRLTERGKLWNWADECDKAFLHLKARLTKQPVLTHPDFKIPFLVDTDASGDGLGTVLSQDIARKEHGVAYATPHEAKLKGSTAPREGKCWPWYGR